MRSRFVVLSSAAAMISTLTGLSPITWAGNVDLPRFPSLSPDGTELVFSWRGDLWKAPIPRGANQQTNVQAQRLTSHPLNEHRSAWSPDGRSIAFESDRDGYQNVFLMNADGTNLRQVTHSDRGLTITAFSPDGTQILGHASREGDVYRALRPYGVSVHGGEITRLHHAFGNMPVISPDGRHIAFERGGSSWDRRHYRGPDARDVWIYSRPEAGGDGSFTQITAWAGNDGQPAWAGNTRILFLSDREFDTVNLYSIQLGEQDARARRLTNFDGVDVQSFTVNADGSFAVLHVWDTLYTLNLNRPDASPVALHISAPEDDSTQYEIKNVAREVTEAQLSPDGQVMAYIAYGEVFIRNVSDNSPTRRVTESHARETDIAWSPDGTRLYFVSDADGTNSIYAATVTLTRSELRESLRSTLGAAEDQPSNARATAPPADRSEETLPADTHPLAGEWSGEISGIEPMSGGENTAPFTLRLRSDETGLKASLDLLGSSFESNVTTFDPTTGAMLLEFTYEQSAVIFEGNVEGDDMAGTWRAAEIGADGNWTATRSVSRDDRAENQAPDSSSVPASSTAPLDPKRWHDAMRFEVHAILQSEHNDARIQPSPCGTMLTFARNMADVVLLDLVTGETRVLIPNWDMRIEWRWSPCGRYIAYAVNDMDFNTDIFIMPIDGSYDPVNITMHPDNEYQPRWSHDGRVMTLLSGRVDDQNAVYRVYLDPSLTTMAGPELEEYYKSAAEEARKIKPVAPIDFDVLRAKHDAGEFERTPDMSIAPFTEADLRTAYLRLERMTNLTGSQWNLEMTPAADRIIFSGVVDGSAGIYSINWKGQDRKRLTGSGSVQHMAHGGRKLVVVSGGQARTVNPGGGADTLHAITFNMQIDLAEQSSWKFLDFARTFGMTFYHNDMKGLDWPAMTERYHDLIRRTRTSDEFAWVASIMQGELNASHLGVTPPSQSSPVRVANGRLGIDHTHLGDSIRVDRVLDQSPVWVGEMALKAGDHIVMVEFDEVNPLVSFEQMLRGRIGEETVLTVHRPLDNFDEAQRDALRSRAANGMVEINILTTPISYGQEVNLRYDDWQRERARRVHELSGGRIGYLHIRGMNQTALQEFERDLFAAGYGREGLIVDVRNNGGGSTADLVLASIMVRPHAYTVARNGDLSYTTGYPRDRLFIQRYIGPMSMLCNEKSFSNAEIVSHAFKTLERGTLVGQQTYGGVISTGAFTLVDGTRVRQPFRGWYLPDGTDMENNGAIPHIVIPQTPEDEAEDIDEQLKAAVREMLGRL